MDFVFANRHGCQLGSISLYGESTQGQVPPLRGMRKLDRFALAYLFAGRGRYADVRGRRFDLEPGDCLLLVPGLAHHYAPAAGSGWGESYVVFGGPLFDLWQATGAWPADLCRVRLRPISYWRRRFQALGDPAHPPTPESSLSDLGRLHLLLSDLLAAARAGPDAKTDADWLKRAGDALEAGLGGPPDDRQVARQLGISYDVFRRRFRKLAGVSPRRFRQTRLVDRACHLLYTSDRTLADIAGELGFCDEFHFSRVFKQVNGRSPSRFRAELRDHGGQVPGG